jgi:hypothetical protein
MIRPLGLAMILALSPAPAVWAGPAPAPPDDPSAPLPAVGLLGFRYFNGIPLSSGQTPLLGRKLQAELPLVPEDPADDGTRPALNEVWIGGKGWASSRGAVRPYASTGLSLDLNRSTMDPPDPEYDWIRRVTVTPWIAVGADWRFGRSLSITTEMRTDWSPAELTFDALERNLGGSTFTVGLGHAW